MAEPSDNAGASHRTVLEIGLGVALVVAGAVIIATGTSDSAYVTGGAPIFAGIVIALHGAAGLAGFKSFVAWRYLLNYRQRVTRRTKLLIAVGVAALAAQWAIGVPMEHGFDVRHPQHAAVAITALSLMVVIVAGVLRFSRLGLSLFLIGVGLFALTKGAVYLVRAGHVPGIAPGDPAQVTAQQLLDYIGIGACVLAGLALFFGCLRAFFTFFTTVPIGGVWIGTSALVVVLSVMNGFERDLREKILGSNAHIQITREDGEFLEWREVKAKLDRIPGVVASTPYAVSEVVIASNGNGVNVIIKGIDPETVGAVTNLVSYLKKDPDAMKRLEPLVQDTYDREVPVAPPPRDGVVDPPPADMSFGGDPIDFSRPRPAAGEGDGEGEGAGSAGAGSAEAGSAEAGSAKAGSAEAAGERGAYGGDAVAIQDAGSASGGAASAAVLDPPPSDLAIADEAPVDYSQPDAVEEVVPIVTDLPPLPSLSRRTQALPGMLVGSELVKQTHLYPGEEVRVVSPLSDPSNPDATGTPIPFNRDYRIAGEFYTGMYEYDLKYVYVTLESLQDFLDLGDAIDGIEVRLGDADDTARYVPTERSAGLIREALGPGYRIVDWRELNRSLFSALKLEKIAMFLVLGIVILVASFAIIGNLIMVVVEKAREIALLKTLGASDFGITQLFAIQGLLIGLIGTLLGVVMGLLGCWFGKKVGIPLDPDVYYINRLPIHVDWQSVAAAGAAGVLISIAATLYPAFLAARVRPAAGMRH